MNSKELASLAALDSQVSYHTTTWINTPARRKLAQILAHSGDSQFWLAGGALLLWKGKSHWQTLGKEIINATLLGALVSYTLKWSFQRPRPEAPAEMLYLPFDKHSFPSGHATRVGSLAAVMMASQLTWGAKALFGIWSLFVCLSRVALGVHFMGDVIAGFAGGLSIESVFLSRKSSRVRINK